MFYSEMEHIFYQLKITEYHISDIIWQICINIIKYGQYSEISVDSFLYLILKVL